MPSLGNDTTTRGRIVPQVYSSLPIQCVCYPYVASSAPTISISRRWEKSLRVALLAPLVDLVVNLLGDGDVGNNDRVEGAGGVAGSLGRVTTGVVLVLAEGVGIPRHAALGDVDGGLGGRAGGGAACETLSVSFP